jgi:hypothetical protein
MSMGESHEHGRTTCAYEGVNGVTFRVIAQSSAVSLLHQLFESLRFMNHRQFSLFPSSSIVMIQDTAAIPSRSHKRTS